MRSPLSHLSSGLNKPWNFNCLAYGFCFRPFTIFIAFLWAPSNSCSIFLVLWCPKLRTGLKVRPPHQSTAGQSPSLDWLAVLCLMYLKMQLVLLAARSHCWFIFNWLLIMTSKVPFCVAALQPLVPQALCAVILKNQILHASCTQFSCMNEVRGSVQWHLFWKAASAASGRMLVQAAEVLKEMKSNLIMNNK